MQYSAVQYTGEGVYSALLGAGQSAERSGPGQTCAVLHSANAACCRTQITADVSVCSVKWSRSGGDTSDNR